MKKLFSLLLFLFAFSTKLLLAHGGDNYTHAPMIIGEGDKFAIVITHFGTTNDSVRSKTYDPMNLLVKNSFPEATVVEAYTSRIVIKRLSQRGVIKKTPYEVLQQLSKEGYTHIIVQSSHIIEGVEMESLRRDVKSLEGEFKDIRVGNPLLSEPSDYKKAIQVITSNIKTQGDAVILVGHGTYDPITASYAMFDYMLKREGFAKWSVATLEGYPTIDDALAIAKEQDAKTITLVPLMYVAGVHAIDDINLELKNQLEAKSYEVEVLMKGLGEIDQINELYIKHIKFAQGHKLIDIMDKKEHYAK